MTQTWLITGATSKIAEAFAHEVAKTGANLVLCGRNSEHLSTIQKDLSLRYPVTVEIFAFDFYQIKPKNKEKLLAYISSENPINLFIAHSVQYLNEQLSPQRIDELVQVNITQTLQLLDTYFKRPQAQSVIFLSSVAAMRGRAKNSLYGASKKTIEIYLEGIMQENQSNRNISVLRLGFVDTKQTQHIQGIIPKASPQFIAKKCLTALTHHKKFYTTPFFWRPIMFIIRNLPFFVYRYLKI